jgi:diguanylate cyclase (GGDEF)-like protein/PAS domain S-box-containing protein
MAPTGGQAALRAGLASVLGVRPRPEPAGGYLRWCLTAGVLTAVLALWLAAGLGGASVSQAVSNVALGFAALAAAQSCLARSRRSSGRNRWAWALLGAAALSWTAGQCCWVWYESILGDRAPFPSVADVGYLAMPPLTAAGLLMLPAAAQSAANRARAVLDGLLIAGSLLLVSWVLVLRPLIDAGGDTPLALVIGLAYPLGDVVVVTIVLFMLAHFRHAGRAPMPLALVGTGLVTFAVSDSGFAYVTLTGSYSSGAVIDLGWFVGFMLILLAARKPPPAGEPAETGPVNGRPLGVLLPYLAVLAAVGISTLDLARTGETDAFVSWNRSVIILLMVGRQVLTLLENLSLTRHLEARVADRTAELRASEQRFRALVQHSSDVVTVVDVEGIVLYQSESITRVFGYPVATVAGHPLATLLDAEAAGRLCGALRQVALRPYGSLVLELAVRHRDGHLCQVEMTMTNLLEDPSVSGVVLNTRDVSERKELEDQLTHEAFHDSLTKLANRTLFKDRVDHALRRRQAGDGGVAVLFLDLDGFKEVNDSLGHASGDQLLIRVAERLRTSVRPEDTVARFGGDEFAVLIETATREHGTVEVARRMAEALREPFTVENQEIHVRASIGIAAADPDPREATDADQLMRNADLAMYRAKAAGQGGFAQYDPQMHTGLVERLQLESDLRRAVDTPELELHYQPTIELATGALIGFEALARWRHPVRGFVSPADFIPLAESTGLIRPIGTWVLNEACRQAASWSTDAAGRPLTMSVNVSGRQFERTDLPAIVAAALAESGLSPDRLCLEMTESVLMNDNDEIRALLRRLKDMGVRLAIDDFGTGYSSLSYLHRFPVDTLKIDRSFVERLSHQPEDAALARAIVQLGQSLGMVTVAEGIEQYDQFLALRQMTCELGQGYYFSRPLAAAEAGRLVYDAAPAAVASGPRPAPAAAE